MRPVHLQNILSIFLLLIAPSLFAQEPLIGEKPVPIDRLSHEPYLRTFAKPLPLDNAQTLYFERDGTHARLWRLDWQSNMATPSSLAGLPLNDDKLRYTAVQTRAGLWLIGPVVMVVKPDGGTVTLPAFGADEPTVVALHDGSVFVLGSGMHNHTETLRRLTLTAQGIAVEAKGELPHSLSGKDVSYKARYGVAALTLADGRVFTAGGGSSGDVQRAAIVDPQNGSVQVLPDMPHKRTFAALVSLPDGRVVVAGHEHLRCYDPDVRTVDVYAPQQNAWQSLPDLPFPLCSDAYNAEGPTGTVLPDGTIVLGGNLEQHVMTLRPDIASASGYARFWEVIGPTDRMRISGVLQALSNGEVVIAGGVHHLDFGGCCYGTPGAERVTLPAVRDQHERFASVNVPLQGAGIAQRGDRVFITSGRAFSFTSTGQLRYSTAAELLDLRSGRVQQLPSLPFVTGAAQAAWLDEDRVLVKGQFADPGNGGFQPGENLSSYIPASSGALAIFHVSQQQWGPPFDNEQLKDAQLLNALGDEALLLGGNGSILQMQLSTQRVNSLSSPAEVQFGAMGRRLVDGRVVVAGGNMKRTRISLINDECEMATANPAQDCPEQFIGWGPLLPAVRYQWYTPSGSGGTALWQQSEIAPDADVENTEIVQTLVDVQGRVLRLVRTSAENKPQPDLWLVRSSSDGSGWQRLTLPNPVICAQGCRLKLAADPRNPQAELLFLREGALEDGYSAQRFHRDKYHKEADRPSAPLHVWWLDESASSAQWREVLQADDDGIRRQPQALTGALAGIRSFGWHLAQPVLWVSQ